MERQRLTDTQWDRIAPLVSGKAGDPGRHGADNRLFVESVLWLARTGAPWRQLPEAFGAWNSAFRRFSRWTRRGVWSRILDALGGHPELEQLIIDATIMRTTGTRPAAADTRALDRSLDAEYDDPHRCARQADTRPKLLAPPASAIDDNARSIVATIEIGLRDETSNDAADRRHTGENSGLHPVNE